MENKKVIVTGASRSIGRAVALAFAQQGATVLASYCHNKTEAMQTVKLSQPLPGSIQIIQADFSTHDGVKKFAQAAITTLGDIDVLVNNAGMLCRDELFELDILKTQQVFQINAIAPLFLSRFCADSMIRQQHQGRIINITSITALLPNATNPAYASSKAAINTWTKNISRTLAPHGILVNAIAPGIIQAGMNQDEEEKDPNKWQKRLAEIPLKRPGSPQDIANMVIYLASDKAAWITGKIFEVDGGHLG